MVCQASKLNDCQVDWSRWPALYAGSNCKAQSIVTFASLDGPIDHDNDTRARGNTNQLPAPLGRVMVKQVPCPGVLATLIAPPRRSTIACT